MESSKSSSSSSHIIHHASFIIIMELPSEKGKLFVDVGRKFGQR
jgi:hypothetical protein